MSRWMTTGLVLAAGAGTLYLLAQRSIYYPMRYPEGDWASQPWAGAEDVWIQTADGLRIHGWWKPSEPRRLVTLLLHGNAGNVTHRVLHIQQIARAGSSILVLDYRGFGRSEGKPSEPGVYQDAEAALAWLKAQGWRPEQIVLHGESLGCAVALEMAARHGAAGVVLEAPFTSVKDVAATVLPGLGPLFVGGYDNRNKIGNLKAPLFIMHGTRDTLIPDRMGRELFQLAREPKEFWSIEGAGHNDIIPSGGLEYAERLKAFYRSLPQ